MWRIPLQARSNIFGFNPISQVLLPLRSSQFNLIQPLPYYEPLSHYYSSKLCPTHDSTKQQEDLDLVSDESYVVWSTRQTSKVKGKGGRWLQLKMAVIVFKSRTIGIYLGIYDVLTVV